VIIKKTEREEPAQLAQKNQPTLAQKVEAGFFSFKFLK
jgi:hypothetical protein